MAPSGSVNKGVEFGVEPLIRPHKRAVLAPEVEEGLPPDEPARSSRAAAQVDRIDAPFACRSKIIPKKGRPLSPCRFARYEGRTMLWPIRYAI